MTNPESHHRKPAQAWKNTVQKWQNIGNFFRKHSRLLTFFGALIVFVTFVVKEGVRERLKELVDSIDAAQSSFIIRGEVGEANAQLRDLANEVNKIYNEAISIRENYPYVPDEGVDAEQLLGENARVVDNIKTLLDNISRLRERLPNQSAYDNQIEEIKKEMEASRKDSENVKTSIAIDREPGILTGKLSSTLSNDTKTLLGKVKGEMTELRSKSATLASQFLQQAEQVRQQEERSYEIYTWASYGLYFLGWGLGLVGRFFSVEGLTVGE
jgi:hypothetical protein